MAFLKISQNLQENTCDRISFLIKKKLGHRWVFFSCEFCETFKNTFFTEHLRTTASVYLTVTQSVRIAFSR